jgi:predicted nucleic acid-binding protein
VNVFLDTSAFAKRYVREPGADRLEAALGSATRLSISVLCVPEFASVLSRLVREGKLSKTQREHLKSHALRDIADTDVCQLTPEVVSSAIDVIEEHPLRTLDALQVASALEMRSDLFVSADSRQLAAARGCGLRTLDLA